MNVAYHTALLFEKIPKTIFTLKLHVTYLHLCINMVLI